MIGDYVVRNYEESKGRPLYLVRDAFNVPLPENAIARASILAGSEFINASFQRDRELESVTLTARFGR
jgi:hypothetical protein